MDAVSKEDVKYFDHPLNGKLVTSEDPTKIGEWNFQKLVNLTYKPTGTGVKGIRGMSNVNSVALSCASIRSGFHFKKYQFSEDHIFVTGYSATSVVLFKSNSIGQIPNSDTFSSFLGFTTSNNVYYSKAPDGCMVVCNGTSNYIWGGNEYRCAGFVMFDPSDATKFYDYTTVVNNSLTDSLNVATIKGTGSFTSQYPPAYSTTYVKATSTSGAGYEAHLTTDPTQPLTGASSNNQWVANSGVTTNQRYHIDVGSAKIITRIYYENSHDSGNLSNTGVKNFTFWGSNTAGSFTELTYGTDTGWTQLTTSASQFDQHAASDVPDPKYITVTNSTAYRYYAFKFADIWGGTIMGCRRIELQLQTSTDIYVGSTRPLKGIKFYIGTANTSAATATPYYWNGSWVSCGSPVDGTSSGGATLAQTGSITFTDTESLAQPSIINNTMLYWYKISCDPVNTATTVYQCSVDATVQTVKDLWDGIPRTIYSFLQYTSAFNDYTLNVYKYDYSSADDGTYVNVSDMTSSQYILCGFQDRCSGISFSLVGSNTNTTASTTMTVYYWNGTGWTTVGTISDGTSAGGTVSFGKSGIVTWTPPTASLEFTYNPNNTSPLYYYKVAFDKTIDNTGSKIYIDYVYGIPAQNRLNGYKFPVFWQNRLWLCSDTSSKKNWVKHSSSDTNCVFNGTDSGEFPIDGEDELMAGGSLFTRFGGYLYDNLVLCKRNQTFLLDSSLDTNGYVTYTIYTISQNIGCVAPYTMKLCDVGYDLTENIKKHVLIWQSNGGIVMFDGTSLITISDDIEDFFQSDSTNYINTSMVEKFYGEFDPVKKQYHWCFATGSNVYLDKEFVYDLRKKAWFEIQRGSTKALQCMFPVEDSYGNKYTYGGTRDGYVERLGIGTTFHGTSITYNFRVADINRAGTTFRRTQMDAVQLVGKTKSTSAQNVTLTHYADGNNTGTTLDTVSQSKSGYRYYRKQQGTKRLPKATFHDIDVTITTDDETVGFEPLLLSYKWQDVGDNGADY